MSLTYNSAIAVILQYTPGRVIHAHLRFFLEITEIVSDSSFFSLGYLGGRPRQAKQVIVARGLAKNFTKVNTAYVYYSLPRCQMRKDKKTEFS